MTSTAAVIGGAGFLGTEVVHRLAQAGLAVQVLDVSAPPPWAATLGSAYVQGDVRDPQAVARVLRGAEVVLHAGFASPHQDVSTIESVNVGGTEALLLAAATHGISVVLISSTIVNRRLRPHPLSRRSAVSRLCKYRESRVAAEQLAAHHAAMGVRVAVARPKTFLGPGRLGGFALLFDMVRRGEVVPVLGNDNIRYQLLDVRDLAAGLCLMATAETEGLFYFGAVEYGTVAEDLGALVLHADTGARLGRIPPWPAMVALRTMELAALAPLAEWHHCTAHGTDSVVDVARATTELGWHPRRSNTDILFQAYDWYVQAHGAGTVTGTHPVPYAHRLLRKLLSSGLR